MVGNIILHNPPVNNFQNMFIASRRNTHTEVGHTHSNTIQYYKNDPPANNYEASKNKVRPNILTYNTYVYLYMTSNSKLI